MCKQGIPRAIVGIIDMLFEKQSALKVDIRWSVINLTLYVCQMLHWGSKRCLRCRIVPFAGYRGLSSSDNATTQSANLALEIYVNTLTVDTLSCA